MRQTNRWVDAAVAIHSDKCYFKFLIFTLTKTFIYQDQWIVNIVICHNSIATTSHVQNVCLVW